MTIHCRPCIHVTLAPCRPHPLLIAASPIDLKSTRRPQARHTAPFLSCCPPPALYSPDTLRIPERVYFCPLEPRFFLHDASSNLSLITLLSQVAPLFSLVLTFNSSRHEPRSGPRFHHWHFILDDSSSPPWIITKLGAPRAFHPFPHCASHRTHIPVSSSHIYCFPVFLFSCTSNTYFLLALLSFPRLAAAGLPVCISQTKIRSEPEFTRISYQGNL